MVLLIFLAHAVFAQADSAKTGKKKLTYASLNLKNRANDHFMIEFSYDNWVGKTDSMNTTGFCRGFAFYFMYDFPFKSDPHFSVGVGIGINASNIFFDKTDVGVSHSETRPWPSGIPANGIILKNINSYSPTWKCPLNSVMPLIRPIPTKAGKSPWVLKPGYCSAPIPRVRTWKTRVDRSSISILKRKVPPVLQYRPHRRYGPRQLWLDRCIRALQLTPLIKNGAGPTVNPYSIGIVLSGL